MKQKVEKITTFIIILVIGNLSQGWLVAPVVNQQVPEAIGKSQFRAGIAGGASYPACGAEADLWLDIGLADQWDLRIQATGTMFWQQIAQIGPSLTLKHSLQGNHVAFLFGLNSMLMVLSGGYHTVGPEVGAVFAIGNPGKLRLVVSPRFALGFGSNGINYEGVLSLGLDIPLAKRFSIRPEIGLVCHTMTFREEGRSERETMCNLGMGGGLVF